MINEGTSAAMGTVGTAVPMNGAKGAGRGTDRSLRFNCFFAPRVASIDTGRSLHPRYWTFYEKLYFPNRGDPSYPCSMKPKELIKLTSCSQTGPRDTDQRSRHASYFPLLSAAAPQHPLCPMYDHRRCITGIPMTARKQRALSIQPNLRLCSALRRGSTTPA